MTRRALTALALTATAACGGDTGDAPIDGPGAIDAAACDPATPWAPAPAVAAGPIQETAATTPSAALNPPST